MPEKHTIVEGDSVTSLADANGFFVGTIWDDSANAGLRAKRTSMDILMPGDEVTIPDLRVASVDRPTDKHHRFKRLGVPAIFRLQVFDGDAPRREQDYLLTIGERAIHGKTDASGVLVHTLPACTQEALLVIGPDRRELQILFGQLDPETELIGVQKRLNNLGYHCGAPGGTMNDATRDALRAFQRRFSLTQTGEADDATKKLLQRTNDRISRFPPQPPEPDEDGEGGEGDG